ncbi:hypothetical protein LUZ61_008911 [Rhynchospora tenuis]|uniref:Reverse transcriptase zinc-binding domain-containing protein n=1 Tax=Rhynchospora tenuis TaxID=198213 RepID=A0AAD6EXU0_9POAL|nr:hypothetical protein LUZ61_008911 [Rhynchospora tenuis]
MIQAAALIVPHSISSKIQAPFFLLQYADDTLFFSTAQGSAVQVLNQVLTTFSQVSGIDLNLGKSALIVPHSISSKIQAPFFLLQYADDTLFFSTAQGSTVQVLNQVLTTFSQVSGIDLNLGKSALITFNLTSQQEQSVRRVLQVDVSTFPLSYLGLPLTLRRPDRLTFQNLIYKVQQKLEGWKSALLSRAWRVVLASTVLSAIPIYFMSVFKLPMWVIKELDRLRRNFIWGSANNTGRATHLLSWSRVCLPKTLGSFGLLDLRLQNISLLLRWWWRLYSEPHSLWGKIAKQLFSKMNPNIPPLAWNKNGSFFWNDLFSLRSHFQICTSSVIGTGMSTMFWYCNWGGTTMFYYNSSEKPPSRQLISLRDALTVWHDLLPNPLTLQQSLLLQQAQNLIFTAQPDRLSWRWTPNGVYTAASAYKFFILSGKVLSPLNFIWKLQIPESIKFFLLLLAHGRLLTQYQLLKRNIPCVQGCILCGHPDRETGDHLFFDCAFSVQLWHRLGFSQASTQIHSHVSLQDRLHSWFSTAANSPDKRIVLATAFWGIWLKRNNRIFRNQIRRIEAIQQWIVHEATLFMKFC